MATKVQTEIESLQTQISQLEQAIATLEVVPEATLEGNNLHSLLKAELASAASESEREQKLQAARDALQKAQQRLAELEATDQAARDARLAKVAAHQVATIANQINALTGQLWELLAQYEAIPLSPEGSGFHSHHGFSVARLMTVPGDRTLPHCRIVDSQAVLMWVGKYRFEELEGGEDAPPAAG